MADYQAMTLDELQTALKKEEFLLDDVQQERAFLGKQSGMHINTSEFARIDRDIERHNERIAKIRETISQKST